MRTRRPSATRRSRIGSIDRRSSGPFAGRARSASARRAEARGTPSSRGCASWNSWTWSTSAGPTSRGGPPAQEPVPRPRGSRRSEPVRMRASDSGDGPALVGEDRGQLVPRRRGAPREARLGAPVPRAAAAPDPTPSRHRPSPAGPTPAGRTGRTRPGRAAGAVVIRTYEPSPASMPAPAEDPQVGIGLRRADVDLEGAAPGDRMCQAADGPEDALEHGRGPPGAARHRPRRPARGLPCRSRRGSRRPARPGSRGRRSRLWVWSDRIRAVRPCG